MVARKQLFSGIIEYDHEADKYYLRNSDGEYHYLNAGDSVNIGNAYGCILRAVLTRQGSAWLWTVPHIPEPREGLYASIWRPELPDDAA